MCYYINVSRLTKEINKMRIYGTKENNKKIAVVRLVKPFMLEEIIAFYNLEDEFLARQYAELKHKEDSSIGLVYKTTKEIAENLNPSEESIEEYNATYSAWCD